MPYSRFLKREIDEEDWQRLRSYSLKEFDVSSRAAEAASRARCRRLSRVAQKGEAFWQSQPGVGPGTIKEIRDLLNGFLSGRIQPGSPAAKDEVAPRRRRRRQTKRNADFPNPYRTGREDSKLSLGRGSLEDLIDAIADRVAERLLPELEAMFRGAPERRQTRKRMPRRSPISGNADRFPRDVANTAPLIAARDDRPSRDEDDSEDIQI